MEVESIEKPKIYFELRYENAADNRRYFYQLDGEGIRYELVAFVRAIDNGRMARYIEEYVSEAMKEKRMHLV